VGVTPLAWDYHNNDGPHVDRLAAALDLDPVIARLLVMRNITTPEAAHQFLHPALEHLHDPFLLTDLPLTVDRLQQAINRGERVAVHGDYDVDGITSTVILRRVLELLGADVVHFIPDRIRDGYGLEPGAIELLAEQHVSVIVSVDCGIRSAAAAVRAHELGLDLLITDHHEPDAALPPAFSVINPKRPDCAYPDKNLAGVGVALKVVHALCERTGHTNWLPGFIKLAAIGTIADVVPLRGENRVIAKLGLEQLSQSRHTTGLRALLEATGLLGESVTSFHVAFRLAPKINAAGRMSTPDLATRLLLMSDSSQASEAKALAERLDSENLRRQQEESEIVAAARQQVEADPGIGAHAILVVWGEKWHRGVIGIVASKLVERFHRPALVLAVEDGMAYGSGRSIPGFDLLGALDQCAPLFLRYGGHRHAAGVTIKSEKLKTLRRQLTSFANEQLGPDELTPRLRIDARLPFSKITPSLVAGLRAMEPFGAGNPRPMFQTGPVELAGGPQIMKSKHLSMTVRQQGRVLRAVAWRMSERAEFITEHKNDLDLAYHLTENHYRGERTVELSIADIKQSGARTPGD